MNQRAIIIGIAGASASGKTLLAKTLVKEIGSQEVVVIPQDSYYKDQSHLTFEERTKTNYDHPNSLDIELMQSQVEKMLNREPVDTPIYDHSQHTRSTETRHIGPQRIIIMEGILLFVEQQLRDLMDIRIFMDTPLDICLIRRLRRDVQARGRTVESVLDQYQATVRPMYLQFIEPSKKHADIIVPRGGENRIAIDMIKAKMNEMLR